MTNLQILDRAAVAARVGVAAKSVTRYWERGQMPQPDGWVSGRPWWYETTIEEWLANRPGRGAGGGRPRKEQAET
jgi:predicted DNA-binding transcriptional regulator AlpA